ncbi:MAG: hypothetical protein B7Y62_04995 [Sphingomonadales bacterium 35-56-22]|nr:MAG: hypothetical protein B7Y62_04995 [Sphingomonadales bacterium 35-56-22]OYY97766.1 MAG: hypothetical protein B7Y38_05715 [Sphingomonadales bacterium 28-56-43]OZA82753.1 MAG: hypothetical protein B7X66_07435 [Sphingomonadales bacterium 39-57-19]
MRRVGVLLAKEYSMANILDISGKPLPSRRRSKRRLRARDMRDLLKVLIMLMMVITGYFLFAPASEATRATNADIARNMPAG